MLRKPQGRPGRPLIRFPLQRRTGESREDERDNLTRRNRPSIGNAGRSEPRRVPELFSEMGNGWRQVEWMEDPTKIRKLPVLKLFLTATITLLAALATLTPAPTPHRPRRPCPRPPHQRRRQPRYPRNRLLRDLPPRPGRRRPVLRLPNQQQLWWPWGTCSPPGTGLLCVALRTI